MPCNQHCLSISSQNETNQLYGNSSILNKTVPKMVRRISGLFTLTLLQNKISMFLNLLFFGDMYFLLFFFLFTFSYSMYDLSNPNRCVTRTHKWSCLWANMMDNEKWPIFSFSLMWSVMKTTDNFEKDNCS